MLYEVAVIRNNDEKGTQTIVLMPTPVIANGESNAKLIAATLIPEAEKVNPSELVVFARPFVD